MSDLISRKYLYNLMCEREEIARNRVLEAPTGSPKFGSCCARLTEITALKHDIADAPTVEARQSREWISMYDAFADTPYHNQNVLIKCDDGFICSARFLISDSGNNCGFYHKHIGFLQCPQVVAWMPYNADMRGGNNEHK